MKVLNYISGSTVVVELNGDAYIDARQDVRYPDCEYIEFVRGGQVRFFHKVEKSKAPELIMYLVRKFKGLTSNEKHFANHWLKEVTL